MAREVPTTPPVVLHLFHSTPFFLDTEDPQWVSMLLCKKSVLSE